MAYTKKSLEEQLLLRNGHRPTEWWAKMLADARIKCEHAQYLLHTKWFDQGEKEIKLHQLEEVNNAMAEFLRKNGFQITTLRVTHDVQHCIENENLSPLEREETDNFCWLSGHDCDDCDANRICRNVEKIRVYDYEIVDDVLTALKSDFSEFESDYALIKVEDVTNPKRPVVLWEHKEETEE